MTDTLKELGIKYHVVGGSIRERLEKIVDIYDFEPVMSFEKAIADAAEEVKQFHMDIEQDAKEAEERRRNSSLMQRIAARLRN